MYNAIEFFTCIFKIIKNTNMEISDIIAFNAVIIAALAFFLTFYSIRIQKKHNEISVRPFLNIDTNDEPISFTIVNRGLGPAIINSFEIMFNKKIKTISNTKDLADVLNEVWGDDPKNFTINSKIPAGKAVLNVGECFQLFAIVPNSPNQKEITNIVKNISEMLIIINYECFYGNKDKIVNYY